MCLVCDVIICGHVPCAILHVIVLDIGSPECDSEVKATKVLQFSGNFTWCKITTV